MHRSIFITAWLTAALTTASVLAQDQTPPTGKELHRAEIDSLLAHPERIFVLDLRGPDEIAKIGTFPGYVNIPLAQLESRLAEVPKDKTILPVSNHSVRAWEAQRPFSKNTDIKCPAVSASRTTRKRAAN